MNKKCIWKENKNVLIWKTDRMFNLIFCRCYHEEKVHLSYRKPLFHYVRLIGHYRFWKIHIHISSMIDVVLDPMMEDIVNVINDIWRNKNFRHVIFLPICRQRWLPCGFRKHCENVGFFSYSVAYCFL